MSAPQRIQLSRRKGWRLPADTVVVSRPSKFGNPFRVGYVHASEFGSAAPEDRADAVDLFTAWLRFQPDLVARVREELAGKSLACWCPFDGQPCHADVLLRIAAGGAP